ncbi:MAG: 50S ribosomal protein L25 [Chloroflexia bacterium]|nr:50S ribosomal protein L25 [Chloroflexia bacterium]
MSHETYALAAAKREVVGKKSRRLRRQGKIPAVLYGFGVDSTNLQLDAKEFETVYRDAGRTALVDVSVDEGRPVRVFVQDVQRHPISLALYHVDFHAVNLRQEITTDVPIVLTGEAPAVHNNEGVLLRGLETVSVTALPTELPHQIDVSIESLEALDDTIHVSDLSLSGDYQIVTEPTEMLARITAQQLEPEIEEEAEELEEGAEAGVEGETDAAAEGGDEN